MPSVFPEMIKEIAPAVTVTPISILAGIHRTEIPVKEATHDGHAESMNWYGTSSMKLGESSQHIILPISELKMYTEVSDTPCLTSDASTIRAEEPSKTINISASTLPAIIPLPTSIPLSVVTEIPSTATVAQHERTVINPSYVKENSKVKISHHRYEEASERSLGTSYSKELYENEKDFKFNTELPAPEILYNDLLSKASNEVYFFLVSLFQRIIKELCILQEFIDVINYSLI